MNPTLRNAVVAMIITIVLAAVLAALGATPLQWTLIPLGIGALWFLMQTVRASRATK